MNDVQKDALDGELDDELGDDLDDMLDDDLLWGGVSDDMLDDDLLWDEMLDGVMNVLEDELYAMNGRHLDWDDEILVLHLSDGGPYVEMDGVLMVTLLCELQ